LHEGLCLLGILNFIIKSKNTEKTLVSFFTKPNLNTGKYVATRCEETLTGNLFVYTCGKCAAITKNPGGIKGFGS